MAQTRHDSWIEQGLIGLATGGGAGLAFLVILATLPMPSQLEGRASIFALFVVPHVVSANVGYFLASPRPGLPGGLLTVPSAALVSLVLQSVGNWLLDVWLSTGESSDVLPGLVMMACIPFHVALAAPLSTAFAALWSVKISSVTLGLQENTNNTAFTNH